MAAPAATWVKVCGLTNGEDLRVAVEAGADAVGFVVAAASPRAVDVETVARLAEDAPVTTVLVTVDLEPDDLVEIAAAAGVDAVQPHGRSRLAAACRAARAGFDVLLPVPVGSSPPDLGEVPPGMVPIFDRADPARHGGGGRPFRWELVAGVERRFVLAGGLGPDNVATAVARARPWGVDASSRLERAPGRKDPAKVVDFITKAKRR